MTGRNKTLTILVSLFIIFISVLAYLVIKLNFDKPTATISKESGSEHKIKIQNSGALNNYLSNKKIISNENLAILNPNGNGSQNSAIKDLRIEMVDNPQANAFYDKETNAKPIISFSHSVDNNLLNLSVYVDREYYDALPSTEERNRTFSSGVLNYLYLITHPSPPFNRQEVQQQLQKNVEELSNSEPLLILN